jgi:(2Fe-2S) ferredoxin
MKNHYTRHLFFCNNLRPDNKPCCGKLGVKNLYRYAKDTCRDANILGKGGVGVSESRCLGRCELAPICVVYPDNVWYQYIDTEDIDEIVTQHLQQGKVVKRLQID